MAIVSHNCIVCASEFETNDEMETSASLRVNYTRFKVCQACLDQCDPADDYRVARDIVNSYLRFAETKSLFKEAQALIDSIAKKS
jgi:hypothetical protein